jgi:iron complex transport system permease protein
MNNKSQYQRLLIVAIICLIALALFSLLIGPAGFSLANLNIMRFRLSRIMLAIIAGSSLAASGASLQAMFKNPLADPHLFGISGGASLGASLSIAFIAENIMPSFGAMLGAIVAFLLIFSYIKYNSFDNCLLIGILINSLTASFITLLKLALPAHKSQSLLFWLIGHMGAVAINDFWLIIPLWLLGMGLLWSIKGELEILSFGHDETKLLGLDPEKISQIAIIANCILIGNAVAWSGMIGFLGLLTPHFIRLKAANLRIVLPLSAILGAIILLALDSLSRLRFLWIKSEIPVGALCALFLSPLFFLLLLKKNHATYYR